jgi:IS30 family transposase
MNYKELTQEQRYQIYALLKAEHPKTEILCILGVHKSSIGRELGKIEDSGNLKKKSKDTQDYNCGEKVWL